MVGGWGRGCRSLCCVPWCCSLLLPLPSCGQRQVASLTRRPHPPPNPTPPCVQALKGKVDLDSREAKEQVRAFCLSSSPPGYKPQTPKHPPYP